MPNIAVIKNGKVVNTIVSTMEFAQSLGFDFVIDITDLSVGIGWDYIDGVFISPPPPEIVTPPNT